MKNKWFVAAGLALIIMVVGLVGCIPEGGAVASVPSNLKLNLSSQPEGISVSGSGKVSAVPDTAVLRLGIEAQESSVALAQEKANGAMTAVMSALDDNGIAEKDIQTQYFNIRKVTRWDDNQGKEVVTGYRVTNMVTAKIREMDRVGTVIDAVAGVGGDLTRIDSIGFTVEEPSAYYGEARQKAMADATSKARQLAELADVKLGKPVYISENAAYPYPVYRQDAYESMAGAPAMETPISPGEMEITMNVQVAYEILD
ncbi:MAG: SIMPL domain-containing protein [Dehalococcoidia bacterium]|nr:SIMPL domain-containing protein [Dehalococcoidia bacterium]